MKILELNPTVVYTNTIDFNLTEERKKFLDNLSFNKENGRFSNERNILDNVLFIELKNKILDHVKRYEKNVCGWSDQIFLKITESWYSKTDPNRDHDRHHHPNSLLSGVYYLDIPKDTGSHEGLFLETSHNIFKNFEFEMVAENHNKYNTRETFVPLKSGDLILFPSWIYHWVSKNTGKTSRKVIAFNTFISGNISASTDYPTLLSI